MSETPDALWEEYLAAATSDDADLYNIELMTEAAHDIYRALLAARTERDAAYNDGLEAMRVVIARMGFSTAFIDTMRRPDIPDHASPTRDAATTEAGAGDGLEAPAPNERLTYDDDGCLDEVVAGTAHLERMGKKRWFLAMRRADGSEVSIWFRGTISLVEERPAPTEATLLALLTTPDRGETT